MLALRRSVVETQPLVIFSVIFSVVQGFVQIFGLNRLFRLDDYYYYYEEASWTVDKWTSYLSHITNSS